MPVHLEDDLLDEIEGQEADERARAPAVLVERQLYDIGLLLLQIFEKRRLVLAPVVDLDRHAASVAARIGDEVPGGENAWRDNVAGTLLCTQAENMLRYVYGLTDGVNPGIDILCQRLAAGTISGLRIARDQT